MKNIRTFLLLFFALGLFVSLSKSIIEYHNKQDFYERHRENLVQAQKENSELNSKIKVSRDAYFLEKILRNKLNYAKSDEFVVLLDTKIQPTKTITHARSSPAREWIRYFFSF